MAGYDRFEWLQTYGECLEHGLAYVVTVGPRGSTSYACQECGDV